jgi:hypothetical protein
MKKTANRYLEFEKGAKPTEKINALYDYIVSAAVNGNWSDLRDILAHLRQYRELDTFKSHIRAASNPTYEKLEILYMMLGRGAEWFAEWQELVNSDKKTANDLAIPVFNRLLTEI